MTISFWFIVWIVTTQCVNFAFYLAVTRVVRGWPRTLAAYIAGYLLPLTGCFVLTDLPLHGGVWGASGALVIGFTVFFTIWGAVTMAMSRGPSGRRFFTILVCGVHQIGAFVFSLVVMHRLEPRITGIVLASIVMAGMGVFLVVRGIPVVMKMDADAGWRELNMTAVMNFALLFATGFWPVYAPTGSLRDIAVFFVANVVAIVYFPVGRSFAEKNRTERALRQVEDNTRVLVTELKSARAIGEDARRVRHDMRRHLSVVRQMMSIGRWKEADAYLANLCESEQLLPNGARRWCAHPFVDALLAVAARKADACGKTLTATVDVGEAIPFDDADIAALVGNLLENAIRHGAEPNLRNGFSRPGVRAEIELKHGVFRVLVANAVGPGFSLKNGFPSEKEGVGLMSVRRVVWKHLGRLVFSIQDGELVCEAAIGCV